MYIEKRKSGKKIKYYLTHSYREGGKTKKIRVYLGQNLSEKEIKAKEEKAKKTIQKQIEKLRTEVFDFILTKNQTEKINKLSDIKIRHLEKTDWKKFKEDFVYNTNAIEGSTIEQEEVNELIEEKPKTEDPEELETLGVAKAIEYIKKTKEGLSMELIKKLHKMCFDKSKSFAGKFRKKEVTIKSYKGEIIHRGVPAEKIKEFLEEMVNWYEGNKDKFKPLVLAGLIHNQFEHIHPFKDGNGRVGRLLLNFILLKNNYPPINIYLKDRQEYYRCLKEYSDNHKVKSTIEFLIKQYKKTEKKETTNSRKKK